MTIDTTKLKQELVDISSQNVNLKTQVSSKQIITQEDLSSANDLLKMVKNRWKTVDDKRKYYKEPFLEGSRRVDGDFKPYLNELKEIQTILEKDKIIPYQLEQEAIRRKEAEEQRVKELKELEEKQVLLNELAEKNNSGFAKEEAEKIEIQKDDIKAEEIKIDTTVRSDYSTGSLRKAWKYKVTNEFLVSAEYKSIDDKKVKAAISAGERTIRGLEIFEEVTGVTSR